MTFDDFVIKLASNNDFFTWLRVEIGSWNSSEAEAGGPRFETLADLREWNNGEIRGFYSDVIVAWVWGRYVLINDMVAAGADFDAANNVAWDGWCRRCGCTWEGNRGPWLSDEDWLIADANTTTGSLRSTSPSARH